MSIYKCCMQEPGMVCRAVKEEKCVVDYRVCPFYKPLLHARIDEERVLHRIASLLPEHQYDISEKYYKGAKPWEVIPDMKIVSDAQAWQDLANAVVAQAARDYMTLLREQKKHPDDDKAWRELRRAKKFFHSDLYACLTQMDPESLLAQLGKAVA